MDLRRTPNGFGVDRFHRGTMGFPSDGEQDAQGRFLPAVNALGNAKAVIGIPDQRDAREWAAPDSTSAMSS